ncbi:unnamed protein product [Paramecium primaurelia]|uniref:Mini antigen n=1 Tax=Paramecium primaurelia TaxID=5886 RepID=A0A8S1JVR1_PARPR|nr:unnamed protein product [Paramecium primaurelia]
MKKMILVIALIFITNADLTFNTKNRCSCGDLTIYQDCAYAYPDCFWDLNSNTCSTATCSNITDQISCSQNKKCMWNGKSCVEFTLCNQLYGYNQRECYQQSINCPQSNGKTCASADALKSCSSYQNMDDCNLVASNDGICYWSAGGCSVIASCDQLSSNDCTDIGKACVWNTTTKGCQQASCAQFQNSQRCTSYLSELNEQVYQLCRWDPVNNQCVSASDTSQLTSETCYLQTKYTYRWVNSTNSCDSCEGKIIYIVIMVIFMIMI